MCLSLVIPCSYWASACYAVLPSRKTLYMISFRQTRDLPVVSLFPHPASFRFPSRGHPCLRLYPSHCRVDSGLAPIRNVRRQAHIKNCLSDFRPTGSFLSLETPITCQNILWSLSFWPSDPHGKTAFVAMAAAYALSCVKLQLPVMVFCQLVSSLRKNFHLLSSHILKSGLSQVIHRPTEVIFPIEKADGCLWPACASALFLLII